MRAPQSDVRHWRFVYQSVTDVNNQLRTLGHRLHLVESEVLPFFKNLLEYFTVNKIFSHAETGIGITYDRDKSLADFCAKNKIRWIESAYAGVIRGIKKRNNWPKHWYSTMSAPTINPDLKRLKTIPQESLDQLVDIQHVSRDVTSKVEGFQEGGETLALRYLKSFFEDRVQNYNKHISKPLQSRKSCSRLSPYLAWGNVSMRQVYQAAVEAKKDSKDKRNINSFMSRLRWHCHFIQKFEMMEWYENENINPAYDDLRTDWDEEKYMAWEEGRTGYPLIDACMRAVKNTGYINFRMRSMLVSFLTHHLWLHWKRGADFLAKQFLDFEPGIHYAQFQMQAGTTGYNTVRIYNPVKQSKDNDPEGEFTRLWVPELLNVPTSFIHEPWKMSEMDQEMYSCRLGDDYPLPIVDIKETYKAASKALWAKKKQPEVRMSARRILAKQDEETRPLD